MNPTEFLAKANETLHAIHDVLEPYYDSGDVDELEMEGGVLNIADEAGRTIVVNIHEASMQIWLASSLSGGMHFDFEKSNGQWKTRDGSELMAVLDQNLQHFMGVHII